MLGGWACSGVAGGCSASDEQGNDGDDKEAEAREEEEEWRWSSGCSSGIFVKLAGSWLSNGDACRSQDEEASDDEDEEAVAGECVGCCSTAGDDEDDAEGREEEAAAAAAESSDVDGWGALVEKDTDGRGCCWAWSAVRKPRKRSANGEKTGEVAWRVLRSLGRKRRLCQYCICSVEKGPCSRPFVSM